MPRCSRTPSAPRSPPAPAPPTSPSPAPCRSAPGRWATRSSPPSTAQTDGRQSTVRVETLRHHRREERTDLVVEDDVGEGVMRRRLAIDDGEPGPALLDEHGKAGGRIDDERRAEDDEEIAVEGRRLGARHGVPRHRLAQRNRRRLADAAPAPPGGDPVSAQETLL